MVGFIMTGNRFIWNMVYFPVGLLKINYINVSSYKFLSFTIWSENWEFLIWSSATDSLLKKIMQSYRSFTYSLFTNNTPFFLFLTRYSVTELHGRRAICAETPGTWIRNRVQEFRHYMLWFWRELSFVGRRFVKFALTIFSNVSCLCSLSKIIKEHIV